jgi:DNA invertase Pin-like site-specific DNA recombinase
MKAAIYCRVSKEEQTNDNQLLQLKAYAERMGYTVVGPFLDVETGSHADREGISALLDAALRREFDLVVFARLDRITRLGAYHMHDFLYRLDTYKVGYKSLGESWLDSSMPMLRDIMISIAATFAKDEREKIISRTKAGLDRARAEGKVLGRPRVLGSKGHVGDLQAIKRLHNRGKVKASAFWFIPIKGSGSHSRQKSA